MRSIFGRRATRTAAVLVCVVLCLPNLAYPLFEDTALFHAIGELMHRGALPYADLVDQKPPAIYLFTWLVTGTFGTSSVAARAVEIAVIAAMAIAVGRVARASGWRWAEESAIVLTGLWSSVALWGLPELGQVEVHQSCAMAWGAALALESGSSRSRGRRVGSGALLALACWFKPQAVVFAIAVTALVAIRARVRSDWRHALRASLEVVAGGVAVTALFTVWMLAVGILDDFAATMAFNRSYVSRGAAPSLSQALRLLLPQPLRADDVALVTVLASSTLGALVTWRVARRRLVVALLAAWWLAAYLQFHSGHFLFAYHGLVVVPVLAASVAVGLGVALDGLRRVLARTQRRTLRVGGALAAALTVWMLLATTPHWTSEARLLAQWWSGQRTRGELDELLGGEMHYYDYAVQRQAAAYIRGRTDADDRVHVIGRAGAFYLHVDRMPASRWLVTTAAFNPTTSAREQIFHQLMKDLEDTRPRYILVRLDDAFPWFGVTDSWTAMKTTPLVAWLDEHYVLERDIAGSFRVFQRR